MPDRFPSILAAAAWVMLLALAMPWAGPPPYLHPFHGYALIEEVSWAYPSLPFAAWLLALGASVVSLAWTLVEATRRRDATRAAVLTGLLAIGCVTVAALASRGAYAQPAWGAYLYAAAGGVLLVAALRTRSARAARSST